MGKDTIESFILVFQLISIIIGCIIFLKITLYYILFYFEFMFNNKSTWRYNIDKPRLAILTILLPSLVLNMILVLPVFGVVGEIAKVVYPKEVEV